MRKLRARPRLEFATLVVLMAFFAASFGLTWTFQVRAEIYPRVVSGIAMGLVLIEMGAFVYQTYRHRATVPTRRTEMEVMLADVISIAPYVLWLLFYYLLIYLIGLVIASALFVGLFLFVLGEMKHWQALIGALAIAVAVFLVTDLLTLALPVALWDPFIEYRDILRLPF